MPARRLGVNPGAMGEEPGRNYSCVVENEQLVSPEQIRQLGETTVGKDSAGPLPQQQHPMEASRAANGRWAIAVAGRL